MNMRMLYRQVIRRWRLPAIAMLCLAAVPWSARAQFQASGSDVLPSASNGKVVTGAHLDATGAEVPNVRVFGYAFQGDPLDPYFTQDPGFNAPAGSGLISGSTLSFTTLSNLSYWNGSGVVNFGAVPNSESLQYTFGIKETLITGSSAQPGFSISTVAADGSLHKHLNAFLNGPDGNSDPSDGGLPTNGVYTASIGLTDTGLTNSDPLYVVYANGVSNQALDRAKFRIRNYNAPGTRLAGTVTNLIGLSPQPGETNLATGGQVTITGSAGSYTSEIDDLTENDSRGSAVLNHIGSEGRTLVMLWLSGSSSDVNSVINSLDGQGGYDIAAANVGAGDPLFGDIQKLSASYPGFSALVAFDQTPDNGALTWDFSGTVDQSGTPTVTLDKIAAVPEPAVPGSLGLLALSALFRRSVRR